MIITKSQEDEAFHYTSGNLVIRVWEIIDKINEGSLQPEKITFSSTADCSLSRSKKHNRKVIQDMKDSRINEPIIVGELNDELILLDGNHRYQKRQEEGIKETLGFLNDARTLMLHSEEFMPLRRRKRRGEPGSSHNVGKRPPLS